MGRLRAFIILFLCICLLRVPVSAASAVSQLHSSAVLDGAGAGRVSLRLQVWLEEAGDFQLWLPQDAREIRLNGRYCTPETDGQRLRLTMENLVSGVHTVDVSYQLPCVVEREKEKTYVRLALLSGLAYPVEEMSFSLSLPRQIQWEPVLSCGYHGLSAASYFAVTVQENTITGHANQPLLDRETLELRLEVDRAMFPDYKEQTSPFDLWQTAMLALMAAAMVYYAVALIPVIPRKERTTQPPDGLAAGEFGTCLTGCGMDLTMMVFSWARLGYLKILLDDRGRVLLHRQMDMGNERSDHENRCFDSLCSQRDTVDGDGLHYARLCRKMARSSPLTKLLYKSSSGNPRIVRILAVAAGVCRGVELSLGVYTAGAGKVFLAIGMGLLAGFFSDRIQAGGRSAPLGNKAPLWISLLCVLLWTGTGWLCGNGMLAGGMAIFQLLTGIAAAVGGRRSALGKQYVSQIRGLKSYLTRTPVFEMQQILQRNPDYFFDRAPEALALGVEKPFARRFGKTVLQPCAYLELPREKEMTAAQWALQLRHTADRLNRRQQNLRLEKGMQWAQSMLHRR